MSPARVLVWSRAGCHLCEEALAVVERVCTALEVTWRVLDLDREAVAEPELVARYADLLPVVLVDGRQVAAWRVDPSLLRAAILG